MNLLFPLEMDTLAYPFISYSISKDKAKVLTIGDSFYKYIFDSGIHTNCFNDGQFWFYSKKIWPLTTNINVQDLNIREEVLKNDIVVLFASEATLYLFPYDFTSIVNSKILPLDEDIIKEFYTDKLSYDKNWEIDIVKKAKQNKISYKEQVERDISWMTNQIIENLNENDKEIFKVIKKIKSDSTWYNSIKEKAKSQNKDINYVLYNDAKYVLESN
jgi:hypothetical protein